MTIAMIAAAAGKKQVIGKEGTMPWHFPSDLKFFKAKTSGHTILMGRVTYECLLRQFGKPLPNRHHVVLTRNTDFTDPRVEVIHDLKTYLDKIPKDELMYITGGDVVYNLAMPFADELIVTHIDAEIDGDAFFPAIDPLVWKLAEEQAVTEKDTVLRFCRYVRAYTPAT